jgi:hypothetical protein
MSGVVEQSTGKIIHIFWFQIVLDKGHWRDALKTVIKLGVPSTMKNLLTSLMDVAIVRSAL